MKKQLCFQKKSWIDIGLGVLSLLMIVGFAFWNLRTQDQKQRTQFIDQTENIAQAIDSETLLQLSGMPSDQSSPYYQHLKQQLMSTLQIFPNVRRIFLIGQKEDSSTFVFIDSETPGSSDESLPGDTYKEFATTEIQPIFEGKSKSYGPRKDKWGEWITIFTPIRDSNTGEVIGAIGMDVDVGNWLTQILPPVSFPILVFVIFIMLTLGTIYVFRYRQRNLETHRKHFYTRYALVICTGLLGVCLTVLFVWNARHTDRLNRQEYFDRLAGVHEEDFASSMANIDTISLESIKQFYYGSDFVTREEFSKFTKHLLKDPFIAAWAWLPEVYNQQFMITDSEAHQESLSTFKIWKWDESGKQITTTPKFAAFPILYISPSNSEDKSLGYDLSSDNQKHDLLHFSMETGITTATNSFAFNLDGIETDVIFVFKPISLKDNPSGQVGVTAAIIQTNRILESVLRKSIQL